MARLKVTYLLSLSTTRGCVGSLLKMALCGWCFLEVFMWKLRIVALLFDGIETCLHIGESFSVILYWFIGCNARKLSFVLVRQITKPDQTRTKPSWLRWKSVIDYHLFWHAAWCRIFVARLFWCKSYVVNNCGHSKLMKKRMLTKRVLVHKTLWNSQQRQRSGEEFKLI